MTPLSTTNSGTAGTAPDVPGNPSKLWSNEAMTYDENHNLPAPIDNDGFAAAASADRHLLKGDIAKFVDGVWSINKQPVSKGTQFVPVKLIMVWVKWDSEKPVDYIFPRENGLLPHRQTLGDDDEGEWAAGLSGEPRDPWQNTRVIHLVNARTAEWITITNSTVGTRLCYEALGQAVATMRAAHPQALPVVELSSTSMKTQFGEKQRPHLRIVGWKQGGSPEEPSKQIEPPRPRSGFEPASDVLMDDAIPF